MAATPQCRLFVILARDGRSAAVFRRGPSRRVALLRWWLGSDRVEIGQWLKGRIYERRCDLSPDGELLVYFAATHRGPYATWTAVSRPPYLTALALWPKGDAWGGGGLFHSAMRLGLNHRAEQIRLAPDMRVPSRFAVAPYASYAGSGEDDPIQHDRMVRDGWRLIDPGKASPYRSSGPFRWVLETPEIYERVQPAPAERAARRRRPTPFVLRRRLLAIGVTGGAWYREAFTVLDGDGRTLREFPDCDWADWQSTGDLLLAANGALHRIGAAALGVVADDPFQGAACVADLAALTFTAREAPPEAKKWTSARRRG